MKFFDIDGPYPSINTFCLQIACSDDYFFSFGTHLDVIERWQGLKGSNSASVPVYLPGYEPEQKMYDCWSAKDYIIMVAFRLLLVPDVGVSLSGCTSGTIHVSPLKP